MERKVQSKMIYNLSETKCEKWEILDIIELSDEVYSDEEMIKENRKNIEK